MEIIIICCVVSDDYKKCYLIFPIYLTPKYTGTEKQCNLHFYATTMRHNSVRYLENYG